MYITCTLTLSFITSSPSTVAVLTSEHNLFDGGVPTV